MGLARFDLYPENPAIRIKVHHIHFVRLVSRKQSDYNVRICFCLPVQQSNKGITGLKENVRKPKQHRRLPDKRIRLVKVNGTP